MYARYHHTGQTRTMTCLPVGDNNKQLQKYSLILYHRYASFLYPNIDIPRKESSQWCWSIHSECSKFYSKAAYIYMRQKIHPADWYSTMGIGKSTHQLRKKIELNFWHHHSWSHCESGRFTLTSLGAARFIKVMSQKWANSSSKEDSVLTTIEHTAGGSYYGYYSLASTSSFLSFARVKWVPWDKLTPPSVTLLLCG